MPHNHFSRIHSQDATLMTGGGGLSVVISSAVGLPPKNPGREPRSVDVCQQSGLPGRGSRQSSSSIRKGGYHLWPDGPAAIGRISAPGNRPFRRRIARRPFHRRSSRVRRNQRGRHLPPAGGRPATLVRHGPGSAAAIPLPTGLDRRSMWLAGSHREVHREQLPMPPTRPIPCPRLPVTISFAATTTPATCPR